MKKPSGLLLASSIFTIVLAVITLGAAQDHVQAVTNGGLALQFDHSDITYSGTRCGADRPSPCSAFMSLRLNGAGGLVVAIHRTSNGSITAPILLNSTVREEKDRNDKTVRWSEYSVEQETPYVHYHAIRQPSFIALRHDHVTLSEVMDQYLSALQELGFAATTAPGVSSNFVHLYPQGQREGTTITLYRNDGGVTARFHASR